MFVLFAFLVMFFYPTSTRLGQIRLQVIAGELLAPSIVMSMVAACIRRYDG